MPSLKERVSDRVARARARFGLVDHLVRTVRHYGSVNGNAQAGAVTFFGFLSFFPLLALAFFTVGQVSKVYDAKRQLVHTIDSFLPGIVGGGEGEIPLETFEQNAAAIGVIGLVGVLYSGLGWLSGMRDALEVVFEMPPRAKPNFVVGKLRDLVSLGVVGLVLLLSVGLSGLIAGFSEEILGWVGLEGTPVTMVLLRVIVTALGIAATTVLFLAMFTLLVDPRVPRHALVSAAVLGGVGFELLKAASVELIGATEDRPAFQAFGIALILVVWINYFSRVVMLSASWAFTSPDAVAMRSQAAIRAPGAALHIEGTHDADPPPEDPLVGPASSGDGRSHRGRKVAVATAGVLAVVGGAAVLARGRHERMDR